MASWRDAIQPADGGVRLLLQASPGAGHSRFPDGYDPWRKRLGIRVKEPARDGRANAAVLEMVADFFGVRSTAVAIESGETDSRKTVLVLGVTLTDARNALVPALGA